MLSEAVGILAYVCSAQDLWISHRKVKEKGGDPGHLGLRVYQSGPYGC